MASNRGRKGVPAAAEERGKAIVLSTWGRRRANAVAGGRRGLVVEDKRRGVATVAVGRRGVVVVEGGRSGAMVAGERGVTGRRRGVAVVAGSRNGVWQWRWQVTEEEKRSGGGGEKRSWQHPRAQEAAASGES